VPSVFRAIAAVLAVSGAACSQRPPDAAPQEDCEPATPPPEVRKSLPLDPQALLFAQLWVFRGECPAPGHEAEGALAGTSDEVKVDGSSTLDFNTTVPFRLLIKPPGPWTRYCSRIVYTARGDALESGRYQFFHRSDFNVRVGHQDGETLVQLAPFGRRCVKMGVLQGAGPDADLGLYDQDRDGIPNLQEIRLGLRPADADTLDLTRAGGAGGYSTETLAETDSYVFGGIPVGTATAFESEKPEVPALHVDRLKVDVLEVTNHQYRACMGTVVQRDGKPSFGCGEPEVPVFEGPVLRLASEDFDLHPVVGVTHAQAQAFCMTRGMRLPTEVEWERCARMKSEGVFTLYPWGNTEPALAGNQENPCTLGRFTLYNGNLPVACANSARMDTGPGMDPSGALVRSAQNNSLVDLGGNVAEWTEDNFLPALHEHLLATTDRAWHDATSRVFTVRGGSYRSGARFVMAQARTGVDDSAENRVETLRAVGFRCVASVTH
jgi:formylglycine-generating enzyme required for sulfatase activity